MSGAFIVLWLILAFLMTPTGLVIVFVVVAVLALRSWFGGSALMQRFLGNRRAVAKLRARLHINPHDRDARYVLAELLVERGEYDEAWELVSKNLAAGDDDLDTRFLAGVAAMGTGSDELVAKGEALLNEIEREKPGHRSGRTHLALGRAYVRLGRLGDARTTLEHALEARPGSLEVHVLLARCLAAAGDDDAARKLRRDAWALHKSAPAFERKRDRVWAWRANPTAAARAVALVAAPVLLLAVCAIRQATGPSFMPVPTMETPGSAEAQARAEADYDAARLAETLRRIEAWKSEHDPAGAKRLQPGLTDAEIDALTTRAGVILSEEVRALYRWHNGTDGLFVDGYEFRSLEHALHQRSPDLPDDSHVLFESEGEYLFIAYPDAPTNALPLLYFFDEDGVPRVGPTNLTAFLEVWAETLEAGESR